MHQIWTHRNPSKHINRTLVQCFFGGSAHTTHIPSDCHCRPQATKQSSCVHCSGQSHCRISLLPRCCDNRLGCQLAPDYTQSAVKSSFYFKGDIKEDDNESSYLINAHLPHDRGLLPHKARTTSCDAIGRQQVIIC